MQQQHLMQMQPMMAAYYPNNVTTDHIQQYLDENKSLILKIVESQNSGKLNECAENQARLQRNLMYLAAIADSQPQPPTIHSQYPSSGVMQAGGGGGGGGAAHYMQQQQQQQQQMQQMSPQALMVARSSMLYAQSQQPFTALQQQAMHSQLGITSGLHMLQQGGGAGAGDMAGIGGSSSSGGGGGFPDFGRASPSELGLHRGLSSGGSGKQDIGSSGSGGGGPDGRGDGGEGLYLKGGDDGN